MERRGRHSWTGASTTASIRRTTRRRPATHSLAWSRGSCRDRRPDVRWAGDAERLSKPELECKATEGMTEMSNGVQERQPTGWTVFAGMVLVIVGSLDALWGLAGILNDQVLVVG